MITVCLVVMMVMVMMVVMMVVPSNWRSCRGWWRRVIPGHVIKHACYSLASACCNAIHQTGCAGYNACNWILRGSKLRCNKTSGSETCQNSECHFFHYGSPAFLPLCKGG